MSAITPKCASKAFPVSSYAHSSTRTIVGLEPVSHYYYSDRLKLQFWDWGRDGLPPLLLVHGGLDHARNWDWVARSLREYFHVYAMDLRGHGNSAWAPGAIYSIAEHVLDIATLVDLLTGRAPDSPPVHLIGHSLGGILTLVYSGLYPDRVRKAIAIEGLGLPSSHRIHKPAPERLRHWIESVRKLEHREPHNYPSLEAAVVRMKEANPHLSDEVAHHLTVHGTNWNSDGSLSWKFDNYVRCLAPYGHMDDQLAIYAQIACPVLLVWGRESWMPDPDTEDRAAAIRNRQVLKVEGAGHWVHHDRLDLFLEESKRFLLETEPQPSR
jgi:pimeloyl-ACP methyl ester carboxylesterase